MLTATEVDQQFKTEFAALVAKYGDPWAIPVEERHLVSERMRAMHVVAAHGKADPNILRGYSVPSSIIEDLCGEAPVIETKRTYRQRKQAVERWCAEHIDTTITPSVIADVGGFSEATARTFINERPDLFTKVKRGYYIVRDPASERAKDK